MSTLLTIALTAILTPLVLLVLVFGWRGLLFPFALLLYLLGKISGR
jgi:hypothetical protein